MDDSGLREKVAIALAKRRFWNYDGSKPIPEDALYDADAILALVDAEYRPGWISVREHLPMLDVPVMVWGERCKNGIGEYWGPQVEGGVTVREGWYSDYGEPIDVTHWRLLPEPPKEEPWPTY